MAQVRILVVDDDEFILELIQETLALEDYQVSMVSDGASALESAQQAAPDVVLLDVNLGGELDGLEVCRRLCGGDSAPAVIFLTGAADAATMQAGREAGGRAYLTKPFSPLALLDAIEANRG